MAQAPAEALQSSLSKLRLSQGSSASKSKKAEPVDSWEDEADDDSSDTETEAAPPKSAARPEGSRSGPPSPPPPTPISSTFASPQTKQSSTFRTFSPHALDGRSDSNPSSGASTPSSRGRGEERRPEKSTAVASRLIAAGIGQKAPRRTKEQREYDQAIKVQEKKKRDQAKAEEEQKKRDKEKAMKDIWDD